MPSDKDAPVVVPHNVMYFNETPRTVFKDWIDAVDVRLMNGPNRETIHYTMAAMREASYSPNLELSLLRARKSASEQIDHPLSLSVEVPNFTFLISGVSRAMTHQIVRARIGVTFAQKCTGDGDIRHDDALVPRGRWRQDEGMLEAYVDAVIEFKHWYARLVDGGGSVHIGRYLMPHCLSQYIYMHISLLSLMAMYGKRTCPAVPGIEWRAICQGMKRAMEEGGYGDFAALLKTDCEGRRCLWHRKGNNDPYIGRLYFPDEAHDVEPWNPASFLHQGTVEEFEDGEPFQTREYEGWDRIR